MAANKGVISWVVTILVLLVAGAVIWSIWSSLQETRAKLAAQEKIMSELRTRDQQMQQYVDSLDAEFAKLQERRQALAAERDALRRELEKVQAEFAEAMRQIDQMWEAQDIIEELDVAFPHWAGQFRSVINSEGIHAIIAPRFFDAEVLEMKTELDKFERQSTLGDSTIANLENALTVREQQIELLEMKADSIDQTYNDLYTEYTLLDDKYRKEVRSHWFKFTPGNALSAGVGAGIGFLVGRAVGN